MNTQTQYSNIRHAKGHVRALTTGAMILGMLAGAGQTLAQQIDVTTWPGTSTYRAMNLERELMADMPANQAVRIGTHNSFNADRYPGPGYPVFQHTYTLYEQLELGVRTLDLDIHQIASTPRLMVSHAQCYGGGYVVGERTLDEMLLEIRYWMDQNPNEVIYLYLEQHIFAESPTPWHEQMLASFEQFLGNNSVNDRIYRPSQVFGRVNTLLGKSTNDIRNAGKRVVILNQGGSSEQCSDNTLPNYDGSNLNDVVHRDGVGGYTHCSAEASPTERRGWIYITAREFRGDPIDLFDQNENGVPDPIEIQAQLFPDVNENFIIDQYELQYFQPGCIGARMGLCTSSTHFRPMFVNYSNSSCGESEGYGIATPGEMREAVRAGFNILRLDPLGKSMRCGLPEELDARDQLEATMWSWTPLSVPPVDGTPRVAMAVVEGDTARLHWTTPSSVMRYAMQDDDGEWSISSASGMFSQAPGDTPDPTPDFRVPGNGFEMQNLFGAMIRAGITRVLVNYHDLDGNGAWTSRTRPRRLASDASPPQISPQAAVVGNALMLNHVLANEVTPPTGRVLSAVPGLYGGSYRLNRPMRIVPALNNMPVSIGR